MKLHKRLVEAVVEAVSEVFLYQKQADKVVAKLLKSNKKWGARDRAFVAAGVYDMVRWWRLISYCSGEDFAGKSTDVWKLFGVWWTIRSHKLGEKIQDQLPEWEELEGIAERGDIINRYLDAQYVRKIAESIPDWLDDIGLAELGDSWPEELTALNNEAQLVLRVNTLKTNIENVQKIFGQDETLLIPDVPDGLILRKRQNVTIRDSFKMGYFEVQDAASQCVAPFLDVKPGHIVIDACAGAGGKTLHLAAHMENKGKLIAMDVEYRKLEELSVRAKRNGVSILRTCWIDSEDVIEKLVDSADRLLLDVPCSGLGVIRRNPDSKWKLSISFLNAIRKVQQDILVSYSRMVKKGGRMVYATCSLLPSESEEQIKLFISREHSEWRLLKEKRMSPARDGFDGFYMALLERI